MKRKICEWLAHTVMAIGVITMLCCVNEKNPVLSIFTLFIGAIIYFVGNMADRYIHFSKKAKR